MSLKKEIEEIILSDRHERWNSKYHEEQAIAILNAVKERIEERIQEIKTKKPMMTNFRIDELCRVKEILK